MVSRIDELKKLVKQGRKPTANVIEGVRRRLAGGNLTPNEKRELKNLAKTAKENVNYYNIARDVPELDVTVTKKRTLPTGKGGTEPLFKKDASPRLGSPKPKSSVKDVAPLGKGGKSGIRRIKSGDTLSAIARRNNTTVAALMKLNPKITDKDKIRAGDTINVGSPEKAKAKTKSVKGIRDFATSIAEAKRKGLKEYRDTKTGRMKAAVTADELKKSGLTLREYLNKMKKKKMNMGGMMSPQKKPTASATGLTGMKGGGMMKKKGYAKGGMKKKGYAMGGAMKRPTANQKGLKKLPTAVRNKMGYMAKGGMTMKKKGMAKGGAARRGR